MDDRKPICLIIAAAYPGIVVVYLLFSFLFLPRVETNNGGLPANFGTGLIIAAIFGLLYLVGVIFLIASFIRQEPYRNWAFACLGLYSFPVLIGLVVAFAAR